MSNEEDTASFPGKERTLRLFQSPFPIKAANTQKAKLTHYLVTAVVGGEDENGFKGSQVRSHLYSKGKRASWNICAGRRRSVCASKLGFNFDGLV